MHLNWAHVNGYAFLPSLIAIIVTLVSTLSSGYLKSMLEDKQVRRSEQGQSMRSLSDQEQDFVTDVAIDWNTRLNFIATMFISLVSCLAVGAQSFALAIVTFFLLIVIFLVGLFWILHHKIGQLASQYRYFGVSDATLCDIVLLVVYFLLFLEVLASQLVGSLNSAK